MNKFRDMLKNIFPTANCAARLQPVQASSTYHNLIRLRRPSRVSSSAAQFSLRKSVFQHVLRFGICGNFGVNNTGDELILKCTEITIKKIFPQAEITIFGKNNLFPFGIRSFLKSLIKPSLWIKPLKSLKQCDAFILAGGLFTDEEGFFVSTFWALQGFMAIIAKKPVILLGVSIGNLNWLGKFFNKKLVKRAKLITVRDNASKALLKTWGFETHVSSDLGMLIPYERKEEYVKEPYIIICIRPYKNMKENLCTILAQFCDEIIEKFGLQIRLLPLQKGDGFDCRILYKIFDLCNKKENILIEPFTEDFTKILRLMQNAEVVITGRLHGGILSLIAETSFIPLSYMAKVKDFWGNSGTVKTIDLEAINLEKLLESFSEIYNNRRENSQNLKNLKQKLFSENSKIENLLTGCFK